MGIEQGSLGKRNREDRQMPAQHVEAKQKRNDLGKHWFRIHGVDAAGKIVVRRRLRTSEVFEFFKGVALLASLAWNPARQPSTGRAS